MARTGPPCPLCGRTGVYAGRTIYIPPSNHRRRVMRWTLHPFTAPGVRPVDVVYDVCPLLDGDDVGSRSRP